MKMYYLPLDYLLANDLTSWDDLQIQNAGPFRFA
jgi:hypothetical protein